MGRGEGGGRERAYFEGVEGLVGGKGGDFGRDVRAGGACKSWESHGELGVVEGRGEGGGQLGREICFAARPNSGVSLHRQNLSQDRGEGCLVSKVTRMERGTDKSTIGSGGKGRCDKSCGGRGG